MITVSVRLYGVLRDRLPKEQNGRATYEIPEAGVTIRTLLDKIGIDGDLVLVALNREHDTDIDQELNDGDFVSVFTHVAGG